jgi:cell division protein FtsL
MVPPGTATARQVAAARPGRQPGREAARPPLRVVPKKGQGAAQGRLATYLAVALVVVALLVVVVGQAMLANGQVRLTAVEQKLVAEQATHRQIELQVANLQQPSRIVGEATGTAMHMVISGIPVQLQHVSLTTPLATPKVTPVPAAPASTAPTAAK